MPKKKKSKQVEDLDKTSEQLAGIDPKVECEFFENLPNDWLSEGKKRNDEKAKDAAKHPQNYSKPRSKLRRWSRGISLTGWIYNIPMIGKQLIKKKAQKGFIVADVVFPNLHAKSFLVALDKDFLEVKSGDSSRFFAVNKLRDTPERYLRVEDGIPTVIFYWDYPDPIPMRPTASEVIDLNTFGILILRQRAKAAAQPIKEFLDKVVNDIKIIKIAAGLGAVGAIIIAAQAFGFIG